jgi:multidrug resistance efflux pump
LSIWRTIPPRTLTRQNELFAAFLAGEDLRAPLEEAGIYEQDVYAQIKAMQDDFRARREQYAAQIRQADQQVEIEKSNLAKLRENLIALTRQSELLQVRIAAESPKEKEILMLSSRVEIATREERDYLELQQTGAIAKAEWESKLNELNLLKAQKEISEAELATEEWQLKMEEESLSAQIRGAEQDIGAQEIKDAQARETLEQVIAANLSLYTENEKNVREVMVANNAQIASVEADLQRVEEARKQETLVSPVNGTVQAIAVSTIGAVVTPAQAVITIVPEGTNLIIEAALPNKDIGFVHVGQTAAIKFDTFSFQKYGTVRGEIIQVSPDAIADEQRGLVYKIKVSLSKDSINVEGEDVLISPGMEGTVEVVTGRRRVIEFFLEPIVEHFDEGLKVR